MLRPGPDVLPEAGQRNALGPELRLVEGAHLDVFGHVRDVLEAPLADGGEQGAELPHLMEGGREGDIDGFNDKIFKQLNKCHDGQAREETGGGLRVEGNSYPRRSEPNPDSLQGAFRL